GRAVIPQHSRLRVLPSDRQCFVHLHILTSLYATAAEDALAWVVAVKGISRIDRVRLFFEWYGLVFDCEEFGGVVDGAIAVVVVTDGAVKQMIAQDAIEGLSLRGDDFGGFGFDVHACGDRGCAGPHEFAAGFDEAGVAGLNWAELRVIADLGNVNVGAVEN